MTEFPGRVEEVKTSCSPQHTLLNLFFLIRNLHYFMTWGVSTMPRPACSTSLSRSTRMCSTSTTTVWCPMRWRYSTGDSKYNLYNKHHQSFISFRNGCGPKLENCLNNKEVAKEELWSLFFKRTSWGWAVPSSGQAQTCWALGRSLPTLID